MANRSAPPDIVASLATAGYDPVEFGEATWLAICPCCSDLYPGRHLRVDIAVDGTIHTRCCAEGCNRDEILHRLHGSLIGAAS
jgi:hypothetical protein